MSCGVSALNIMNEVYAQNLEVSHLFSAPVHATAQTARQFADQAAALKFRVGELEKKMFASTALGYAGKGNVLHFEDGLDSTGVRELADAIAEHCGAMAAVFSGTDGSGYGYCLVTRSGDLRAFGKQMTSALQGRGGGKPICQQGRVAASRQEIEVFFAGQEL